MELPEQYFEIPRQRNLVKNLIGMQKHASACTTPDCTVPRCDKTKSLLKHVKMCEALECKVRQCLLSRQAEHHTRNCKDASCVICHTSDKIHPAAKKRSVCPETRTEPRPHDIPSSAPLHPQPNSGSKTKSSETIQQVEVHRSATRIEPRLQHNLPSTASLEPQPNSGSKTECNETIQQEEVQRSATRNKPRLQHNLPSKVPLKHQAYPGSKTDSGRPIQQLEMPRSCISSSQKKINIHMLNSASTSPGSRQEQSHCDATKIETMDEKENDAAQPSLACTVNRQSSWKENATTTQDIKPHTNNAGYSTKRNYDMSSEPTGSNRKVRRVEVQTNDFEVAIANQNLTIFTSEQTRQVEIYLKQQIRDIIKNKDSPIPAPQFSAPVNTDNGVLKLWCKNKETLTWLKDTVVCIEPLWADMRLMVKRQIDLMFKSEIYFNADCECKVDEIRETLIGQNKWARVDLWKFDDNIKKKGSEIIMEVEFPSTLVDAIQKHQQCLSFELGVANIQFVGLSHR